MPEERWIGNAGQLNGAGPPAGSQMQADLSSGDSLIPERRTRLAWHEREEGLQLCW